MKNPLFKLSGGGGKLLVVLGLLTISALGVIGALLLSIFEKSAFAVEDLPFRVDTVAPAAAGNQGGNFLSILGSGFNSAFPPEITLGERACGEMSVQSPSVITCKVPSSAKGNVANDTVDVKINGVKVANYTYIDFDRDLKITCGFKVFPDDGLSCDEVTHTLTFSPVSHKQSYFISQASLAGQHRIVIDDFCDVILSNNGQLDLNSALLPQTYDYGTAGIELGTKAHAQAKLHLHLQGTVNAKAENISYSIDPNGYHREWGHKAAVHVPELSSFEVSGDNDSAYNILNASSISTDNTCGEGAGGGWYYRACASTGAAIGSDYEDPRGSGTIKFLQNAKVNAVSSNSNTITENPAGPAIGSAGGRWAGNWTSFCGDISILDSVNVTASTTSSTYGTPAIGSGFHQGSTAGDTYLTKENKTILINTTGSVVASTSGGDAPAIGSGGSSGTYASNHGGSIIIKSGTVKASRSGGTAAVIGGGPDWTNSYSGIPVAKIQVDGGLVITSGGSAGLGSATSGTPVPYTVEINGGNVVRTGGAALDSAVSSFDGTTAASSGSKSPKNAAGSLLYPVYFPANIKTTGFVRFGPPDNSGSYLYPLTLSNDGLVSSVNYNGSGTSVSGVAWLPAGSFGVTVPGYTANRLSAAVAAQFTGASLQNVVLASAYNAKSTVCNATNNKGGLTPNQAKVGEYYQGFLCGTDSPTEFGCTTSVDYPTCQSLMPPGLTINTASGEISGIPTQAGSWSFRYAPHNSYGTNGRSDGTTITVSPGTPEVSSTLALKYAYLSNTLADVIAQTPTIALKGNTLSSISWEQSADGETWSEIPLTQTFSDGSWNSRRIRMKATTSGGVAYSNIAILNVQTWGLDAINSSVPDPASPVLELSFRPVSAANSPTAAKYCISVDTYSNSTPKLAASDTRCGAAASAANPANWVALSAAAGTSGGQGATAGPCLGGASPAAGTASACLNFMQFPAAGADSFAGSDGAGFGSARSVTIFLKSAADDVSDGLKAAFTLNKVDFAESGDGGENVPEFTPVTYYALSGTRLGKVPALPSLPGFDPQGWKDGARVASGLGAGGVGGEAVTAATILNSNKTALVDWKYTPKVLDFNPKKAVRGEPTDMTIIGEGFIGWGRNQEQAKTDDSASITVAGDTCTISLLSATEINCQTAGAVGSGAGKVIFGNARTVG